VAGAGREWLERNLGGPPATSAVGPAGLADAVEATGPEDVAGAADITGAGEAMGPTGAPGVALPGLETSAPGAALPGLETGAALSPQMLARQRIEFDGQSPQAAERNAAWPAPPPTLAAYVPIDWPAGLAPQPATEPPAGESLPPCDVLIVTWTVEEGRALARVLTPGCESIPPTKSEPAQPGLTYWKPYTRNYDQIAAQMDPGAPARQKGRLGTYWTTEIAGRRVTLFKSDSHMSQDGPDVLATTPNRLVWRQIIEDCKPRWVITTGTAGGIGARMEVGDVVVSRFVTFDAGGHPPALEPFDCPQSAPSADFDTAHGLFAANAAHLPRTNDRPPRIVHGKSHRSGVVTTRGFQYDDTADTFELKGKGDACEMGDAVLAYVCKEMGSDAPAYAIVRNVSDPEIDSSDPEAPALANYIYAHFGRWSSVCSAIVCWAIVAALDAG
jgi:nucleoside phosphorylase